MKINHIFQLSNPAYLGFAFNPVVIYYCFDTADDLVAVLLDVTNTPWKDTRQYFLDLRDSPEKRARWFKDFHVSPLFDLAYEYEWALPPPKYNTKLTVLHTSFRSRRAALPAQQGSAPVTRLPLDSGGLRIFDAGFSLQPKPLCSWTAQFRLLLAPLMTCVVVLWIHIEAGRVWLAGVKYVSPPANSRPLGWSDAFIHLLAFVGGFLHLFVQLVAAFCGRLTSRLLACCDRSSQ